MQNSREDTNSNDPQHCESVKGETIILSFSRSSKSHKYCIICKSKMQWSLCLLKLKCRSLLTEDFYCKEIFDAAASSGDRCAAI